jgi:hypothetical protein
VTASEAVAERARTLEQQGLRGLDALHFAAAEAAGAALLVTTDDRFLKRGQRGAIKLRVVNPIQALAEIGGLAP